ncbi:MAG: hypothetical protein ACKPEN_14170 [Planktothrix sp.]
MTPINIINEGTQKSVFGIWETPGSVQQLNPVTMNLQNLAGEQS